MGNSIPVVAFRGSYQPGLSGSFPLLFQAVLTFPAESGPAEFPTTLVIFPGRRIEDIAVQSVHHFFAALTLHVVWVSAVRRWEPFNRQKK